MADDELADLRRKRMDQIQKQQVDSQMAAAQQEQAPQEMEVVPSPVQSAKSVPAKRSSSPVRTPFPITALIPYVSPNLMVESPVQDVAALVAALTFHAGEVQRNPYHLSLPAWMQDNVRRGAELVGGQGGAAPSFAFATLYRWRTFGRGQWTLPYTGGRQLTAADNLASLLAPDQ